MILGHKMLCVYLLFVINGLCLLVVTSMEFPLSDVKGILFNLPLIKNEEPCVGFNKKMERPLKRLGR